MLSLSQRFTAGKAMSVRPVCGLDERFCMTEKNRIIDALGERKLLLPGLVNAALAANDQTISLVTLLQTAKSHADHPQAPFSDLRQALQDSEQLA